MDININHLFRRIALNDDRKAYNAFFDYYYPRLIKFALIFVNHHSHAEEVVSEALIKIFKNRKKLAKINRIEGYIFITVKNQCLKFLKKNNQHLSIVHSIEEEDDFVIRSSDTPEREYLSNEFCSMLNDAIDQLPSKRKMIFQLVKEEGLKYKDVAELLNISVKTVEVHMGLALRDINAAITMYRKGEQHGASIRHIK